MTESSRPSLDASNSSCVCDIIFQFFFDQSVHEILGDLPSCKSILKAILFLGGLVALVIGSFILFFVMPIVGGSLASKVSLWFLLMLFPCATLIVVVASIVAGIVCVAIVLVVLRTARSFDRHD